MSIFATNDANFSKKIKGKFVAKNLISEEVQSIGNYIGTQKNAKISAFVCVPFCDLFSIKIHIVSKKTLPDHSTARAGVWYLHQW